MQMTCGPDLHSCRCVALFTYQQMPWLPALKPDKAAPGNELEERRRCRAPGWLWYLWGLHPGNGGGSWNGPSHRDAAWNVSFRRLKLLGKNGAESSDKQAPAETGWSGWGIPLPVHRDPRRALHNPESGAAGAPRSARVGLGLQGAALTQSFQTNPLFI